MGETTGIEWAQRTWNPWQGCEHVSPGCFNCYMYSEKRRFGQDPEVPVRSAARTFNAPKQHAKDGIKFSTPMLDGQRWTQYPKAAA